MVKCDYCGKENQAGAVYCGGCGTPQSAEPGDPLAVPVQPPETPRLAAGENWMMRGVLWFAVGTGVTMLSCAGAESRGGRFSIFIGAIAFGIGLFIRGWSASRGTDEPSQAQELLDLAARLESHDRAAAIAVYEEVARRFPNTQASKEARRNIDTLTAPRAS